MAKYQAWYRFAVLIFCSVAVAGCLDNEPSNADIKASLSDAYGCAPELFDEIKITNIIPNDEYTKYVDFDWYITYKPSDSIRKIMKEAHKEANNKERLDKIKTKQAKYLKIRDTVGRSLEETTEFAKLETEIVELKKLGFDKIKALESRMKETDIFKCQHNAARAAGYHVSGGVFGAHDSLGRVINESGSKIFMMVANSYKRENLESLEQDLSIGYESKKLMIKTKNGWRFKDASVPTQIDD